MNTQVFVRLLGVIRDHLAICDLPAEIASVEVSTLCHDGEVVTVHLGCGGYLPTLAAGLLAWADTLSEVSVTAWRVPHGNSMHLIVNGLLADELPVHVYGGVSFDPDTFGSDLQPGERHTISLGVVRSWTAPGVMA